MKDSNLELPAVDKTSLKVFLFPTSTCMLHLTFSPRQSIISPERSGISLQAELLKVKRKVCLSPKKAILLSQTFHKMAQPLSSPFFLRGRASHPGRAPRAVQGSQPPPRPPRPFVAAGPGRLRSTGRWRPPRPMGAGASAAAPSPHRPPI